MTTVAPTLRDALASYATGVAVVTTTEPDGRPVGLTVNSFTSVSLRPPLVLWCLRRESASCPAFLTAPHYAVNVLAATQEDVARRFATRHEDRFDGVTWQPGHEGLPLLTGTLARLVCRTRHRWTAGDHLVLVGEVVAHDSGTGPPLIFHGHHYGPAAPVARIP